MDAGHFRIVAVCTGNICRSPAAERLLGARLGDAVSVSSAGVRAVVGAPIDPGIASLLRTDGIDPGGFAARQLTAPLIRDADLVLALTRTHKSWIVEEEPTALRRTFTLLEFARIVSSGDFSASDGGLPALVEAAARHRRLGEVVSHDDVPDPYGRDSAAFATAYRLIVDAVTAIAQAVGRT